MESTNFFKQVSAVDFQGDLNIIVTKTESGMVTNVYLNNETCGDKARKLIIPLTLRGTAEELDADFFAIITAPLQQASGLMVNMESFMKQLEEAKKHSAMVKEKTDLQKKEREAATKKFNEIMKQVEDLEKAGKYQQAWMKVPDPGTYPEHADALRKRKVQLSAKFPPDLFGAAETVTADTAIELQPTPETDTDGNRWEGEEQTSDEGEESTSHEDEEYQDQEEY